MRFQRVLAALLLWGAWIVAGPQPVHGKITLSTGVRYDQFRDTGSSEIRGNELTLPFGLLYQTERMFIACDAAYSDATVSTESAADATISSFTDTRLSASYMFPELPIGLILGVDVNLPTGKEYLTKTEKAVEIGEGHELFEVDDFGEGLNIGLSLGVVKEFGPLSLGLNGAYVFKRSFDPSNDSLEENFDPGDQFMGVALVNWEISSNWQVETFAGYSWFGADRGNGQKTFKQGAGINAGGSVRGRVGRIDTIVETHYTMHTKNRIAGLDSLEKESDNSNGSEFFGRVYLGFDLSPRATVLIVGNIKRVGESERRELLLDLPIGGKRLRYALGPGVEYALSDQLSINGLVKYFRLRQQPDIRLAEEITFHGVNLALGVRYVL